MCCIKYGMAHRALSNGTTVPRTFHSVLRAKERVAGEIRIMRSCLAGLSSNGCFLLNVGGVSSLKTTLHCSVYFEMSLWTGSSPTAASPHCCTVVPPVELLMMNHCPGPDRQTA